MTRIIEVIYFGFELDLLEAHIATHRPNVQRLIVAESRLTSTGYNKPLYARDNWDRFEEYDVDLVELPTDGYRQLVPSTNRPGNPPEMRLTPQEKIKKRYMHEKLKDQADWIFHADTDEIISDYGAWWALRQQLSHNPQWTHVNFHLREVSGYVNVRTGMRDVYRLVNTIGDFDPAYAAKHLPRGTISPEPIGWHFHMCCSMAREYYLKWLNRTDDWGSYGDRPPSMDEAVPKIAKHLALQGKTDDPMLNFATKHFPKPTAENLVPLTSLPDFIREHITWYPHVEEANNEL